MSAPTKPMPFPLPEPPSVFDYTPHLAELRENQPVAEVALPDGTRAYLVTAHELVRSMLVDPRFSSRTISSSEELSSTELGDLINTSLIGMDPPAHTRMRRLVAPAFTARRIEQLRPRIAATADELIDAMMAGPPPADLVSQFAVPMSVQVICEILGVPPADKDEFYTWSSTLLAGWDRMEEKQAATVAILRYLRGLIADKRANPGGEDVLSVLTRAHDDEGRLTEYEVAGLASNILSAGHETTANQIVMFLLTLLRRPDQLARLRADHGLHQTAIEELLRYVPITGSGGGMPKITTTDVALGGVTIPAGSLVIPSFAGANRDPAVFRDPERLDLARAENPHIAFGVGMHHCLGAQLARLELQEALGALLRRMPAVRLAVPEAELRRNPGSMVLGVATLPIAW
jgi:cytochrome P450